MELSVGCSLGEIGGAEPGGGAPGGAPGGGAPGGAGPDMARPARGGPGRFDQNEIEVSMNSFVYRSFGV